jgi:hypothetical protein
MKAKALCMAVLTASFALPLVAVAQQPQQPMTHDQMNAQKKAQKQEKKAANDRLKAQKEKNKSTNHENKAADAADKGPH